MFVVRVIRRLHATRFARIAASLSFTTLLGVVPLFTVAFAYVAPYSMFEHWQEALEPVLLKFLLPGSSASVRQYLAEFTAKTASLKGIGTTIVVLTAVLLIAKSSAKSTPSGESTKLVRCRDGSSSMLWASSPFPRLIGAAVYATSW